MYNILKSSKNDGSVSRTIKGLVPFIALVLVSAGVDIESDTIEKAIYSVAVAISAMYAAYGAILKVYNKVTGDSK